MKTIGTFLTLIATAFLSACSVDSPTSAPTTGLAKPTHNVTWNVSGALEYVGDACGDNGYTVRTSAAGELSHLGSSTAAGENCVEVTYFLYGYIPYMGTNTMSAVVTAANGDEIWVSTTGTWTITSFSPLEIEQSGSYTITGGTGRFDDAQGSGTYTGMQYGGSDDPDNTTEFTFTGTLRY